MRGSPITELRAVEEPRPRRREHSIREKRSVQKRTVTVAVVFEVDGAREEVQSVVAVLDTQLDQLVSRLFPPAGQIRHLVTQSWEVKSEG